MLFDGASKTVVGCNFDPKHPELIGLILGPARGLTDTGAQQPVVGSSAALRWCDRLLKRHGLVPVDVTRTNMIATCGGIGTAKVVQVLDFSTGIVGVNGVMRFLVLEEPMSTDGRQQFIPPLATITIVRRLGANIRMKESGDVLEIDDDRGTIHTGRSWSESDLDMCTTSWTSFREKVGNCQTACTHSSSMTRSSQAIVMRNVRMGSTNSRAKNKRSLRRLPSVTRDYSSCTLETMKKN